MERNLIKQEMWGIAGKAGLVLGVISTSYMFLTLVIGQAEMPAILNSLLTFILWGAKFAGCIWVMTIAMKGFAGVNESITNKDTFRLGMLTALLSAFVFSLASYANTAFISADILEEQMNMTLQQMAPMMDSNTMNMMDKYMQNLPWITFISNMIYCFLYGTVLSAILSRNIPAKDPFADYKQQDQ